MIQLQSNVKQVIARLEKYQREFPNALRQALGPKHWLDPLKRVAHTTLLALADNHRGLVHRFVDTVVAQIAVNGFSYSMTIPSGHKTASRIEEAQDISEKYRTRQNVRLGLGPDLMEKQTLDAARKAVADWVQIAKDKTAEDITLEGKQGRYHNELVERIWWIVGIHPSQKSGDITPNMELAGLRLTQAINDFMAETGEGFAPETLGDWLRAVLAAWRSFIEDHLPTVIDLELAELRNSL